MFVGVVALRHQHLTTHPDNPIITLLLIVNHSFPVVKAASLPPSQRHVQNWFIAFIFNLKKIGMFGCRAYIQLSLSQTIPCCWADYKHVFSRAKSTQDIILPAQTLNNQHNPTNSYIVKPVLDLE